MTDLAELLERLEVLAAEVDTFEPAVRETVLELVDLVELLHRSALSELAVHLGDRAVELRAAHPAIAWLFDAYDVVETAQDAEPPRETLPLYPA